MSKRKNTYIILSVVAAIYIIFSTSGSIYAFKSLLSTPAYRLFQNQSTALSDDDMPRDFKIMDEDGEGDVFFDNAASNDQSGIPLPNTILPWKGPKLVVIDPGHGGKDPGAVSGNLLEKDVSLDVSLKLNTILKQSGIDTYMTRSDDSTVGLRDRIEIANKKNAILFVSVHCNWFRDPKYNGTMTLYNPTKRIYAGYLSEINYAEILQKELMKVLATKDLGIIDRPNLAVLRHANMPSVIVELGFISNKSDSALLLTDAFRQKSAEALAEGIRRALTKVSSK